MRTPSPAPPAHPRAASLLASPWFLAAVALLLLNDHVLKAAYGNWITGKLSDFAGVFAFALFWTALLPRHRRAVFALTGVLFALWKTPLADPVLAAWNGLGVLPLARVVDYTDWIALLALLPAHRVARHHAEAPKPPRPRLRRRLVAVGSAVAAVLAFTATSIARPFHPIPDLAERPVYPVPATRSEIAEGLRALSLLSARGPDTPAAPVAATGADTLALLVRQPPERRVHLWVQIREGPAGESAIRLIGARAEGPMPSAEGLHRAYTTQVHEPLLAWLARSRAAERR